MRIGTRRWIVGHVGEGWLDQVLFMSSWSKPLPHDGETSGGLWLSLFNHEVEPPLGIGGQPSRIMVYSYACTYYLVDTCILYLLGAVEARRERLD